MIYEFKELIGKLIDKDIPFLFFTEEDDKIYYHITSPIEQEDEDSYIWEVYPYETPRPCMHIWSGNDPIDDEYYYADDVLRMIQIIEDLYKDK